MTFIGALFLGVLIGVCLGVLLMSLGQIAGQSERRIARMQEIADARAASARSTSSPMPNPAAR